MGLLNWFNDCSEPEPERGIFWHESQKVEGKWQGIPGIIETFKVTKPAIYQKIQLQPLVIRPDRSNLTCLKCGGEYVWNTYRKFCKKLKCAEVLLESHKHPMTIIEFNEEGVWQ